MIANFTSVLREDGLLPVAQTIQKRLRLNPGDQVSVSIKVLNRPTARSTPARYDELLQEKDARVLTPAEQAELIALANAEFDAAIAHARSLAQEEHLELFDGQGRLKRRKVLAFLRTTPHRKRTTPKKAIRKKQ